jgi:chromosome segregation ATPase
MIMALFTKKTDAATISAELTAKRATFAQVQQEIRDLKTQLATNEVRRGQLHVAAALDGQDVRADLQALDTDDRQLQQQIAQKEAAARHLPMVVAELEKRHRAAVVAEAQAQFEQLLRDEAADVGELHKGLLKLAGIQARIITRRGVIDELRSSSALARADGAPAARPEPAWLGPILEGIEEALARANAGQRAVW